MRRDGSVRACRQPFDDERAIPVIAAFVKIGSGVSGLARGPDPQHCSPIRSTWLCSRNDLVANTGVICAAAMVWWLDSIWPDVIVGVGIAALFLRTAVDVIGDARAELREADEPTSVDAR